MSDGELVADHMHIRGKTLKNAPDLLLFNKGNKLRAKARICEYTNRYNEVNYGFDLIIF
jgi:hypothetical protein